MLETKIKELTTAIEALTLAVTSMSVGSTQVAFTSVRTEAVDETPGVESVDETPSVESVVETPAVESVVETPTVSRDDIKKLALSLVRDNRELKGAIKTILADQNAKIVDDLDEQVLDDVYSAIKALG